MEREAAISLEAAVEETLARAAEAAAEEEEKEEEVIASPRSSVAISTTRTVAIATPTSARMKIRVNPSSSTMGPKENVRREDGDKLFRGSGTGLLMKGYYWTCSQLI